ncbi:MAG: ankyrin repeat domain-containing protein [Longimicrobiales bacterium]|nr:ankyrin repeat domain-containing protein [Longimicrobiales bacterium]
MFELLREGDAEALAALLVDDPALVGSVDEDGMPLLHAAAQTDDPELVELLLVRGAERDARAPWGHTALQWAANMNARQAAARLLQRGAPLDLWSAAALGRSDDVRTLLEAEATSGPDARGEAEATDEGAASGDTDPITGAPKRVSDAFYIACRNGALETAKLLRKRGAEVDALGYFDATALHWAAINGHTAVVEWLVQQGADTGRCDPEFGATPAGWAREGGHGDLTRWLEEAHGRSTASSRGELPPEEGPSTAEGGSA